MFFRHDFNESFANSYSFFWTNFWYLPAYFFIIFFIFCYFLFNFSLFQIIPLIFYLFELYDFSSANFNFTWFNFKHSSFNFLLTNNLNKYHPFFFYLSVWFVFLLLFQFWHSINKFLNFLKEIVLNKLNLFNAIILNFNFTALFCGSWWALQEGTWGGWWNWDSSEVFGLLVFCFALNFYHVKFHIQRWNSLAVYTKCFVFIFVIFYAIIQLSFELISHNFGIKFFYFFNNSIFLIEIIILSSFLFVNFLLFWNINSFNYFLIIKNTLISNKLFKLYLSYLLLSWLLLIINYSFNPILNYLFWNVFKINYSSSIVDAPNIRLNYIIMMSIIFLFLPKYFHFVALWILLSSSFFYVIFSFIYFNFTVLYFIHFNLFYFLFLSLLSINMQLNIFFYKSTALEFFYITGTTIFLTPLIILDWIHYNFSSELIDYFEIYILAISMKSLSTFFSISYFFLVQIQLALYSSLIVQIFTNLLVVCIELHFINNYIIVLWIFFFNLYYFLGLFFLN